MRNLGYQAVLGMDTNDNLHYSSVSEALTDVGIKEAVISNHRGKSVLAICSEKKITKTN